MNLQLPATYIYSQNPREAQRTPTTPVYCIQYIQQTFLFCKPEYTKNILIGSS